MAEYTRGGIVSGRRWPGGHWSSDGRARRGALGVRWGRAILVASLAACLGWGAAIAPTLPVPGAQAAQADFEYRVGSGPWASTPPALFDASWAPAPGSQVSTTLELRSHRPTPTVVAVYLRSATAGDTSLLRQVTLTTGAHERSLADANGSCVLLGAQDVVQPGGVLSLPVTFALDPALETAQSVPLSFELELSLSETGPALLANGCPIDPEIVRAFPAAAPGASIPDSGTDAETPLTAVALFIVGSGLTVLAIGAARGRRKELAR